jgi:hypothetical protein
MEHLGIDVHKVESQICILTESGEVVERRIRTQRERFAAVLGERPRARVLIEASTESEWVARCLEELGHEVVVADPNFAAMYATRSRKVKTDLRDARTLCTAPSVGPVTAAAFSSTVDDPRRFKSAHQWRPIWGSLRANGAPGRSKARAHHQGRQQPDAETAGAGRGLDPAPAQPANRGAAEMGHRHRGPAREEDRHRGPGAEDERSSVAWPLLPLHRAEPSRARR